MNSDLISKEEIMTSLAELQIPKGCILMTHSSMKSFGKPVDGGAETVLTALLETIGETGTLLMPTLTFSSVNEEKPVMDMIQTRSDCGALTEVLRKKEGAYRSCHVVSSACAYGPKAQWLTEWHDDTPCGEKTPYGKVISEGGYVLFLGAGFGSNTLFHAAEEAANRSYLKYALIEDAKIIRADGSSFLHTFRRYNCSQTGIQRYLQKMESIFMQKGVLRRSQAGNCTMTLIRAQDDFEISCEVLRNDLDYILMP